MFRRSSPQEDQLKQIKAQLLGMKMNLEIFEQNVSHGITGINALRSQKNLLLENLRILKEEARVVSIESVTQIKSDLKTVGEKIAQALAIYNNVRRERDDYKKHYDLALENKKRFVEENLSDAKILIFKRKRDGQKSKSRGNSTKTRK